MYHCWQCQEYVSHAHIFMRVFVVFVRVGACVCVFDWLSWLNATGVMDETKEET